MLRLPSNAGCPNRRGTLLSLAAVLLVLLFGFAAFSVDVGYIRVVRSELQDAAETAALKSVTAAVDASQVQQIAAETLRSARQGARRLQSPQHEVETGLYDPLARSFIPKADHWNAVRVTAWAMNEPLFFAPAAGDRTFNLSRTTIAVWTPRDIVFVVDLRRPGNATSETLDAERLESLRRTLAAAFEQMASINEWLPPGAADRAGLVTLVDDDGARGLVASPLTTELPQFVRGLSDIRLRTGTNDDPASEPGIAKARKLLRSVDEGGSSRADAERLIVQVDSGAGSDANHSTRGPNIRISIPFDESVSAEVQESRLHAFLTNVITTRTAHIAR